MRNKIADTAGKIFRYLKKKRLELLVLFIYTIISVYFLCPLLKDIRHTVIPGDGLFTSWTIGWDIHSFLNDPLNIFNANIFYPNKNTLAYSDILLPPALLGLPVFLLTGSLLFTYNTLILISFILSAWGVYLLAKYHTKNTYASFIAGLIYGFATYKFANLGHFQNLVTFWIPFTVLYLQKYFDTFKRKYLIFSSLFFIAQMLSSWNNGAFLAFFLAFVLIVNYRSILANFKAIARDSIIPAILVIVLILPFTVPYIKISLKNNFKYSLEEASRSSADLGGYIVPLPGTNMAKLVTDRLGVEKKHWAENMLFLGYFSILLIGYFLLFARKKITDRNFKMYLAGIPLFMLLSFGPFLNFIAPLKNFPLPYYFLYKIFHLGFIRTPSRMAIVVLLCTAVAIAFILNSFRIKNRAAKYLLGILIPAFIFFEFYTPGLETGTLKNVTCPAVYDKARENPSVKAIIELPFSKDVPLTLNYVFFSTCHYKPIYNGYSGYAPPNYGRWGKTISGFPDRNSLNKLDELGINFAVLHLDLYPAEVRPALLELIQTKKRLEIIFQDGKDYLIKIK